jgi:hypothetical protein
MSQGEQTGLIPPDAVRVWRGYRAPTLAVPDFLQKLGSVFVPATVQMQIRIGLDGYIPSVFGGLVDKPDSVPDETAILFWDSQQTYSDGFKTLAVRTYTLTHNAVYRPPSGANFPQLFGGALVAEQPYYLIDKPADWMKGRVEHLIGARPPAVAPATFRSQIATVLADVQHDSSVGGAIACAGDDYLVYWELDGAKGNSGGDRLAKLLAWSRLSSANATTLQAGLWDAWPGMTINSGDSFNMQFQRRWER